MAAPFLLGRFLKRNAVSITFPAVAIALILADYSYTLKCKAEKLEKQKAQEEL